MFAQVRRFCCRGSSNREQGSNPTFEICGRCVRDSNTFDTIYYNSGGISHRTIDVVSINEYLSGNWVCNSFRQVHVVYRRPLFNRI